MVIADNLYDTAALSRPCWPLCRNHFPSGKLWLGRAAPAWAAPLCEEEEKEKGSAILPGALSPAALEALAEPLPGHVTRWERRPCACAKPRRCQDGAPFQHGLPEACSVRNGQHSFNRLEVREDLAGFGHKHIP